MKYGFYEFFKPLVKTALLEHGVSLNSIYIFMIAGALAETIGSSVLCPFEAARIRIVSNPAFASSVFECVQKMVSKESPLSLFVGLPAILLKNVPYSLVQLSFFEFITGFIYSKLAEFGKNEMFLILSWDPKFTFSLSMS
jgi:solute carrier family 25 phosphate transporter 3